MPREYRKQKLMLETAPMFLIWIPMQHFTSLSFAIFQVYVLKMPSKRLFFAGENLTKTEEARRDVGFSVPISFCSR